MRMMSSVLSQEEINALLNDTFSNDETPADLLTAVELDTIGEIANISMGSAATALSSLLGKRVEITTPDIELIELDNFREKYDKSYVIVDVNYNQGLKGSNILIVHTYDAGVIVDLMMGGDGSQPPLELNDLHLSAVSEAMNQMMGASCTSLSQVLNKRIDITPPVLDLYEMKNYTFSCGDKIVKIAFRVVIQDLVDSEMVQLLPVSFAKTLTAEVMSKSGLEQPAKKEKHRDKPAVKSVPVQQEPVYTVPDEPSFGRDSNERISVAVAEFEQLRPAAVAQTGTGNLDIILDVGLELSVELGRTQKRIKEILEFTAGSIIELDKLAGEPVDIMVNGKLLAKGEVVVIDENFGVRVTEIISPLERVKNLK